MGQRQSTKEHQRLFLETYRAKACNISETCEAMGMSRTTFYRWREKSKKFNQAVFEVEEALIDMAEMQLLKNIKAGKERSLIFFLENKRPDKWQHKVRQEIDGNFSINMMPSIQVDGQKKDYNIG